jgi:putative ABC transport system permease protein
MIKTIRMRLRALFNRAAVEAEMNEELRFHLERQAELFIAQGLSRADAMRRARLEFGSVEVAREGHRDHRGTRSFEDSLRDVRYAVRSLWRDRALSLAGVGTLALGIGAVTAVFSAVNEVMLRDLPYADPSRLVQLWEQNTDRNWYKNVAAPANFLDWKARVPSLQDAAGYFDYLGTATLLGHGEPKLLTATSITGNFFSVLGIRPVVGPGMTIESDINDGARPEVMISYRLWRGEFRGDTSIVGKTISLAGNQWYVVGVMPRGFSLPSPDVDIYTRIVWGRQFSQTVSFRRAHNLRVVARLKPGYTVETADAALQTVAKQLEAEYPATNTRMGAGMTPMSEWVVGDTKRPLLVLLSSAAVLLLIACANVGNLLLVHATGRTKDVALRFVLGATRGRVARQALTESLVLSGVGGILGTVLGWFGAKALLTLQPAGLLPVSNITLDYRVLGVTTLLVAVSGALFGVAPALIATRQAPAMALASTGRTITGGRVRRWGRYLVVAEVALAVVLMVGAGLLVRSYDRLSRQDPGFDPNGVMTMTLGIPFSRYDSAFKVTGFYRGIIDRARALPGVEYAGVTRELPATTVSWSATLGVEGRPPLEQSVSILYREVMGDYFKAMRVKLLDGRAFSDADRSDAPNVAIINEAMAKQYFPNENPVGLRISGDRVPDSNTTWRTVVGVVGSERQGSLAQPSLPEVYLPLLQNPTRRMSLVVRAKEGTDPLSLAPALRRSVRDADSLLAISFLRSMNEVHATAMSRQRFTSILILSFAITGVVLALVGVFGVLAQLVQTRWREMGIRMALGAQREDVRWMVVRSGATLLGAGLSIGLLVSLGATQVLTSLLYQTQRTDALTYGAVALLIAAVGIVAASVPAWRASSADPAHVLRGE